MKIFLINRSDVLLFSDDKKLKVGKENGREYIDAPVLPDGRIVLRAIRKPELSLTLGYSVHIKQHLRRIERSVRICRQCSRRGYHPVVILRIAGRVTWARTGPVTGSKAPHVHAIIIGFRSGMNAVMSVDHGVGKVLPPVPCLVILHETGIKPEESIMAEEQRSAELVPERKFIAVCLPLRE